MCANQHYHLNVFSKLMRLIPVVVILCCFQCTLAQRTEIDSLENLVKTETSFRKVDAANALAFRWILNDFKKAEEYIIQARQLAEALNYTKGISEALIYQGLYEGIIGNRKVAIQLLTVGKAKAKQSNNRGWEGYALLQLGNIYRDEGHYDSAKFWYKESYNVLRDSLNPWHLSVLHKHLSGYYKLVAKPKLELSYLLRSLAIREKLEDKVLLADILVPISKWYLDQSNIPLAIAYIDRAQTLSDPNANSEIQKEINYQKAIIHFQKAEYKTALDLLSDVKEFYQINGYVHEYVKILIDVAKLLNETGNYDISLKNGFEALKICEEKKYLNDGVKAQIIIGYNYYRLKRLQTAHQFATAGIKTARENRFEAEEASGYSLEGIILRVEKKYEDALFNFEKALEITTKLGSKEYIAAALSDISQTYVRQGKLQQALLLQKQSVAIKESILHQSGLAWGYYDLGDIYTKLKDFNNAQNYLDKAEAKARYIKSGLILLNVYQTRRDLQFARGSINEALRSSFLYEELKDSVYAASTESRVLSLQSVYEVEKKDQQIELLNKTKQLQQDQLIIQQNKIQRQQFFIVVSVIALVLLTALAYTLYSYFKRMRQLNKEVQERNEEIQAQSEELSETNSSLIMLNRQLAEKQEEIQAQAEELTEANNLLVLVNLELAEKHEQMTLQSEELSNANSQFIDLNKELENKQKELEAQAKELRKSYEIISELNENLEQKVKERTREMKQAYKELDTFFYRSSHDFRRPLTTFMGLSQVAKITVKDQNALDLFEKVKETAIHLDRMLIKLQSISDVGAHQFVYKEVSMQTIFDSVLDTYREPIDQFAIRISISVSNIKTFLSYPAFLKIIVENLLENAIQFRGRNDPYISMSAIEKFGGIEISMQDNGQGVEKEYQDRLFDMFFRGNEHSKGNGLGLYIVKKAVTKLGGTLHLETTFGEGMVISIWIPLKQINTEGE